MATFAGWGASWASAWERAPALEFSSTSVDAWGLSWGQSWARAWGSGPVQSGQVYGGKRRQARVDDLTAEHVRKQWEYLEEKAAREAKPPAAPVVEPAKPIAVPTAKAPTPAREAPAAVAALPQAVKVTNPKDTSVTIGAASVSVEAVARDRAELDKAVRAMRQAVDDALILSLLND